MENFLDGFEGEIMAALDPTPFIWSNGKLIPWDEAQTHVLSHGLHYGTGYFEGIRAYQCDDGSSAVFRLDKHMERLVNSGKILGLPCPYNAQELAAATVELLKANELKGAYIRPLAFVGYGALGVHPGNNPIDLIIAAWSWGAYLGEEGLRNGITMCTSSYARHHVNSMMTKAKACGNYVNSVLSKTEAVRNGYDEAMVLDTNGFVSEATGENIFIIRDKVIKTTPLTSVLEGITRNSLVELARDLGYTVVEQQFTRDEVYIADEVFCSGTAAEVTPVRMVDNRQIGAGKAGPITLAIQEAFFDIVKGNTPKYDSWLTKYTV